MDSKLSTISMVRDGDGETVVRKPSRSRVIGQASVAGPHRVEAPRAAAQLGVAWQHGLGQKAEGALD